MANANYSVKIIKANKELSVVERIKLKDIGDAVPINDKVEQGEFNITPDVYAELAVHNDKSENKDYAVYVIIDKDGTKYFTSSPSFWESFCGIMDELDECLGENIDGLAIKVFTMPSKNFKGKSFITCSLA